MDKVFLNGNWIERNKASVSVFDRGFMFGDGVYEVLAVSKGKIRFNGLIKGTLEAKSLYVGEDGFIDGKATADEAVILGNIKGSLKGKKVRLAATSRIEGDTYHEVIAIEDGAIYEGSIKRIKS